MASFLNLARMTTATTGTGTITLGAAVSGYLSFADAGAADGKIYRYGIKDGAASEAGYGTYTTAGTTFTRTVRTSTNSNNAINLSGTAEIFITALAEDFLNVSPPQGRLTLATGVPVMTTTQSAKTTLYYTPYVGQLVPLYDGTSFNMVDIGAELSVATTDTTKNPAAIGASKVNDWYVWNDAGTIRLSHGVDWTSDTARNTTNTLTNGIYLNTSAITNGPAALRGTYVGTTRSNASSQLDWIFGAVAANGTAGFFGLWNMYNRVHVVSFLGDNTNSWTYATATWRAANGSATMRHTLVRGYDEDGVIATYICLTTVSGSNSYSGVGLDTTTNFTGTSGLSNNTATTLPSSGYAGLPGVGVHYFSANEYSSGATTTFYGDIGGTLVQTGLQIGFAA